MGWRKDRTDGSEHNSRSGEHTVNILNLIPETLKGVFVKGQLCPFSVKYDLRKNRFWIEF